MTPEPMSISTIRRRLLVALVAGVVSVLATCVLAAAPAWAHATLLSTTPANGQSLPTPPSRIQLQFTEPVGVELGSVRLLGPSGAAVETGKPTHPSGDGTTVTVPLLRDLPDGMYTVAWRVVSADSHAVQGAFAFTVGSGVSAAGAASRAAGEADEHAEVNAAYAAARWIGFLMLALLVGSAFFVAACWPDGARNRRVRRIAWVGWAGLLTTTVVAWLLYGPYAAGRSLAAAFDPQLLWEATRTRPGLAVVARVGLLLVLAPALFALLRSMPAIAGRSRRAVVASVIGVAAALAATWSVATHSGVGGGSAVALPADIVHLVAMAVWVGGLAVLVGALLPARDLPALRSAVPRFSRTALTCVILMVGTGIFQSWRQVRTLSALVETEYGRLLIGKLVLVVVLVALGVVARAWVRRHYFGVEPPVSSRRPSPPREPDTRQVSRLRRLVAVEAGLTVAILGLSTVLITTQPAREALAAAGDPSNLVSGPPAPAGSLPGNAVDAGLRPVPYRTPSGSGFVAVALQPPRVGTTILHVSVVDAAGNAQALPEVRVSLSLPDRGIGPLPVRLGEGAGHYASLVSVPLPGKWMMDITLRTSEVDQTTVRLPLDIQP